MPHIGFGKNLTHRSYAALMFILIVAVYAYLRSSLVFVWNDSPALSALKHEGGSEVLSWGFVAFMEMAANSFGNLSDSGYRPLSNLISAVGSAYFIKGPANIFIWSLCIGALIGAFAVSYYYVARRFLSTNSACLAAVFIVVCSPPIITGSWVVFAGIQIIVPLLICGGLLLYWKYLETSSGKAWSLVALCTILIIGPWFREFIGVLALLIIVLEIQRRRRLTLVSVIATVSFVHAVFPTAAIKLLFFSNLPLKPISQMGLLGTQLAINETHGAFDFIQTLLKNFPDTGRVVFVCANFLTLFPPLLLLLAAGSVILSTTRIISLRRGINPDASDRKDLIFLFVWFVLSFVPFFKIYTAQVHLAYALLPATILIVIAIEHLSNDPFTKYVTWRKYALATVLVIVVLDQGANLYSSHKVVKETNNGILVMSDWFRKNVPKGSLVISNALHAEDIRLYADGHFVAYWTVRSGIPYQSRSLETPDKLADFLKINREREIFFLDVDYNFPPSKVGYHSHRYVHNHIVATEYLGLAHVTKTTYPIIDPFKMLTPREIMSFLGPPDLENDFYRGPAQDGTLFLREVFAEYHVYRIIGERGIGAARHSSALAVVD